MKSKKSVIKDVIKPTSISPKSSFTDPNDPWSAKANVAENITSKRSDLLKQFYKSKGWNVNYISKNKKVSQSKKGDYEKWKRDRGIYEEDQIDEVSNELLGRYKTAAGSQASALDKAGGKENIQKANKRFSGIVKATKKQFANDDKKQGVMEMDKSQTPPGRDGPLRPGPDKYAKPTTPKKFKNHALSILQKSLQARYKKKDVKEAKDAGEYDYEGAMAKTQLQTICRNAEALKDMLDDDENLPEWVQAKITKAEDYISTSLDYLKSTDELEEEFSLDEALSKNSTAYNWIHDFVHSDNPKFDGKSKAQRMQMALAAYYAMQKRSRTKNEEVEPIEELNKDTLYSYVKKSEKDQDKQFTTIGKALSNKVDAKSGNAAGHKFTRRSIGINRAEKRLEQEGVGDPQAATQSPADGANGGEELAPPKKSIKRIVKEFHSASRKVQEDLYDWEKDDKAAKPYGKKPTTQKIDGVNNIGDDKPNARLILKGGKTLTGEPRDTVELDPMMKNRSKMPDYKSMDKIKQKPQEQ
jgi:hypothetical protein